MLRMWLLHSSHCQKAAEPSMGSGRGYPAHRTDVLRRTKRKARAAALGGERFARYVQAYRAGQASMRCSRMLRKILSYTSCLSLMGKFSSIRTDTVSGLPLLAGIEIDNG